MKPDPAQVSPIDTLRRVLDALQNSGHGLCVVTDDAGRLLGTLTDGDCRRALLAGKSLDSVAAGAMNTNFISVDESISTDEIARLMRTHDIRQIPILDADKRVIRIVSERMFKAEPSPRKVVGFILAGGKGTRLRPLTRNVPKPMLPVGGKPMLEHLVTQLVRSNITNIYLSINYLGNLIEEHFGDGSSWGCNIKYIREDQELGTGGSLRLLNEHVHEPVVVANGDLVTTVDFAALVETHLHEKNAITVGVSQHEIPIPFGVVRIDSSGRLSAIEEKPTHRVPINAGIYVIEPRLFSLIPPGVSFPITSLIELSLEAHERVSPFMIHENWSDVGIPSAYASAQGRATR